MSRNTVLGVIDMQNVFGDPASPWGTPGFEKLFDPVRLLVTHFAPNAVFTRFVCPAQPSGSWVPYYEEWGFALKPPADPLWDIVPELVGLLPETFGSDGHGAPLSETTFSKWSPRLASLIGSDGRLVLCGVTTDCCVITTALAAADAGAEVWVVPEACAGSDDESHQAALHVLGLYAPMIKIVPLEEALHTA
jgi:nicotinamidase-related amidase